MITSIKNIEVLSPKNQLYLFGYEDYFKFFIKLFEKSLSGFSGKGFFVFN